MASSADLGVAPPSDETAAFWQALVRGERHVAQEEARRVLGLTPRVSLTYSFEEEASLGGGEGERSVGTTPVAPDTPGPTVELWNQEGEVPFVVISGERHCLARLGTSKAEQDFQACLKPTVGTGEETCAIFRHIDPKMRFGLPVAPAVVGRLAANLDR